MNHHGRIIHDKLPLRLLRIARPHHRLNVSTDVKVAFNLNFQRITCGNEVFENDVGYMLVEDFDVPKRVDVELQTLQLNTSFVGNVLEANGGEVGEVGKGADCRELSYLEVDPDFLTGKLIRKGIQRKQTHLLTRS